MSHARVVLPIAVAVAALAAWAALGTGSAGDAGHDHHGHHHGAAASDPGPAREEALRPRIPDVTLVDQHGAPHRFYSDLVKGRTVLINAIYTSCDGSCPVQTSIFRGVRKMLGERVGRDVQMISVSLDPATDTPERLQAFADKLSVDDGWIFLTGTPENVARVLQAMDLWAPAPEEHTPMAAVGHEPGGVWMKVVNLSSPVDIVHRLDTVKSLGEKRAPRG